MTSTKRWLLAGFALLYICGASVSKRNFKCPSGCSCSKETIICVGTSQIPRAIPAEFNSLFIEGNKIETITKNALRGLRDLTHLDLRGNSFQCSCENKWLMTWLKNTNATVSDVFCAGPSDMKDKRLNDLPIPPGECISTGKSVVGCRSVLIDNHVLIIVTQLFGGSHIYKFDDKQNKFTKFQTIEIFNISKPNDIEVFQMDGGWYFMIVDSSKAGLSTLYKWSNQPDRNETGFFSYQFLHEWFRDTDAEFVEVDGKSYLILASRSQSPVIYLWNKSTLKFILHGEIPNVDDVVTVKSFQLEDELYLALTCYIGDSKILKWTNKQFIEVQPLPSRGAMILQPFTFTDRHYLALGSDYSFTQIYLWDVETKTFHKFKDIYVQSPRSFTVMTTDRRNFIFSSSFKGKSMFYEGLQTHLDAPLTCDERK
ncbi:hypothetical protein PAMP_021122 [Pampus punctatissimus]